MATAQGIISVVTANMAKAIRVISVQRGHDPRDYALMAFGGAGPLHAARLARELDMKRILVPRNPGICCAGAAADRSRADFRHQPAELEPGHRWPPKRQLRRARRRRPGLVRAEGISGRAPRDAPHRRHALCRPELRTRGRRARPGR
jgi:hypothetical protein